MLCWAAYDFDARFNYNFDANCLNTVTKTRTHTTIREQQQPALIVCLE